MTRINRQVLIAELPKGKLSTEHFKLVESAIPAPGTGQVLLRNRYIAVDAAMRAWMLGPTYRGTVRR
jgi:NADPH-dependent curcumin reductase CurA